MKWIGACLVVIGGCVVAAPWIFGLLLVAVGVALIWAAEDQS